MKLVKSILMVSLIIVSLSIGGIALFWLADALPALKTIIPLSAFVVAAFQVYDELKAFKEES